MSYTVTAADLGRLKLGATDTVTSVLQNVAIILSTPRQSVPQYRGFGLPMAFVDRPIPAAKAMITAEISEALAKYEPRAALKSVSFVVDETIPGRLVPTVEVDIIE